LISINKENLEFNLEHGAKKAKCTVILTNNSNEYVAFRVYK